MSICHPSHQEDCEFTYCEDSVLSFSHTNTYTQSSDFTLTMDYSLERFNPGHVPAIGLRCSDNRKKPIGGKALLHVCVMATITLTKLSVRKISPDDKCNDNAVVT